MKRVLLCSVLSIFASFSGCSSEESVISVIADFENHSALPRGPYKDFSQVWEVKYPVKLEFPGSLKNSTKMIAYPVNKLDANFSPSERIELLKHFSVHTDKKGENWLRFCVDTEKDKGTSSGSDYLRTEISCNYISEYDKSLTSSKGYTFEVGGTFRINTSQLYGNRTTIPGTEKKTGDKVNFLQIHEERENGFTNGKHNPPTIQIYVDRNNNIGLNYCPDRLKYINNSDPNDTKPGTKSFKLYENYKNLEQITVKIKYTGREMYVYVNGNLKFDANANTKAVFGADTNYTLYENKNTYVKFGCYANTYKGLQVVYIKDIEACHYKTDTDENKIIYWIKK